MLSCIILEFLKIYSKWYGRMVSWLRQGCFFWNLKCCGRIQLGFRLGNVCFSRITRKEAMLITGRGHPVCGWVWLIPGCAPYCRKGFRPRPGVGF